MSIELVLARITELRGALAPAPPAAPPHAASPPRAFASVLDGALAPAAASPAAPLAAGPGTGAVVLAAVQGEVGQAEWPDGSNDSPRIAMYRTATAGSGVGPWCAYFTSWAARQSGAPLGDRGEGFGSVDALYAWAQRAGRAVPASAAQPPRPGDLIVWDEHIGIVEGVLPDGRIQTIEGNSSNMVARRIHDPGGDGALGYVRM